MPNHASSSPKSREVSTAQERVAQNGQALPSRDIHRDAVHLFFRRIAQRLMHLTKGDSVLSKSALGGVLFLAACTILSARAGITIDIGARVVRPCGPRRKCALISRLKVICRPLSIDAEKLLGGLTRKNIGHLHNALADIATNIQLVEDDFLSWLYQDLKQVHADSAFAKALSGNKKLTDNDLLAATQFFTDRYMVEFLVRECLSRAKIERADLRTLAVIDPACGGGNFLLAAFDQLWTEFVIGRGMAAAKTAQWLLSDVLVGYDLDPLMASLCRLNLILKAHSHTGRVLAPTQNIFGGPRLEFGFLDTWSTPRRAEPKAWGVFRKMLYDKRRRVFISNPPFAGRRDLDPRIRSHIREQLPLSRGDLCVAFMEKILSTLQAGDVAGFVTQRSWMYLSSYEDFRATILSRYALEVCVDLGPKAFKDIGGEKSSVALAVFAQNPLEKHICRFYRVLDPSTRAKQDVLSSPNKLRTRLVTVPQLHFQKAADNALRYFVNGGVSRAFSKCKTYGDFALPMQGTSTGDHKTFIDVVWKKSHDKDWRMVSKGGGYCKWAGLNHYAIRWGANGEYIRANPGSALRNLDKIYSAELAFSDTGSNGLSVRLLQSGQIFVSSGPGIKIRSGSKYAHLAFLNSKTTTFFLRQLTPKLTVSAGYLAKLPVPESILSDKAISAWGARCVALKVAVIGRKVKNPEFCRNALRGRASLNTLIAREINRDLTSEVQRLRYEALIEASLVRAFRFDAADLATIHTETGQCAFTFRGAPELFDIIAADAMISRSLSEGCEYDSKKPINVSVGCEGPLEELAFAYLASPEILHKRIVQNLAEFPRLRRVYLEDFLHKEVLFQLGFSSVAKWQISKAPKSSVTKALREQFPDLNSIVEELTGLPDIETWVDEKLPALHLATFLKKPILVADSRTLHLVRM